MSKSYKLLLASIIAILISYFIFKTNNTNLPVIAIANYGPHSSLQDTINGLKEDLAHRGFIEDKNIKFETVDVNFDQTLIPQMLSKLKASKPKIFVALTTPVAQAAKSYIKDIPVVFAAITDPVEAGLIEEYNSAKSNVTGAADRQDLRILLKFAKQILPQAKTVGILYSTSEANDAAFVKMMNSASAEEGMQVMAIPIEQPRDIPFRMRSFKDKVDFIYVSVSGPIQPALPAIVAEADKMRIPVFNADSDAVKKNQVLGSMGVTYLQVGANVADIVVQILQGKQVANIPPIYPAFKDHQGYISKTKAEQLGITLPKLHDIIIIE